MKNLWKVAIIGAPCRSQIREEKGVSYVVSITRSHVHCRRSFKGNGIIVESVLFGHIGCILTLK